MTAARQRQFEVLLPIGYDGDGAKVHKRATIRKLRGHEEALFYDSSLSAGRLVTELLRGCLVRLGDADSVTSDMVSQLYSADRNYLIVELRRITIGDALHASYSCPSCGKGTAVIENLSQIEIRRLGEGIRPSAIRVELEDGYEDREGTVHTAIQLRLSRGTDEEIVSRTAEKDPLHARDVLILRCIESFGTMQKAALEAYGIKILRELTLGDRQILYRAIEEQTPGVDFRRSVPCSQCHVQFPAVLETSSFFEFG